MAGSEETGFSIPLNPQQDMPSPPEEFPKKRQRISLSRKAKRVQSMPDESVIADKENLNLSLTWFVRKTLTRNLRRNL